MSDMQTFEWAIEDILDKMLGEASWLLSHAEALADYGRKEESLAELARAAGCEEQVACWLDAAGREQEAVVHRVSAASCYEQLGEYARAVTLLRAALYFSANTAMHTPTDAPEGLRRKNKSLLSAPLPDEYRQRVEKQLAHCLKQAQKELWKAPSHAMRKSVEPDLSGQEAASNI